MLFKSLGSKPNFSFMYKQHRLVVKDGYLETSDTALIAALGTSPHFEKVDPKDLPKSAEPKIAESAKALLEGKAPAPKATGMATSDKLATLKASN